MEIVITIELEVSEIIFLPKSKNDIIPELNLKKVNGVSVRLDLQSKLDKTFFNVVASAQ